MDQSYTPSRRVFTAPVSSSRPQSSSASTNCGGGQVETLYHHASAKIISFTAVPASATAESDGRDSEAVTRVAQGSLSSWTSRLERTIAVGPFRIYRAPGSVAFLSCGAALQPILPKSRCWCVDEDSSIYILHIRRPNYWRIEMSLSNDEERGRAQMLKEVLSTILQFENTPCPFQRSFTVPLPATPATPVLRRPWTPVKRSLAPGPPCHPLTPTATPRSHTLTYTRESANKALVDDGSGASKLYTPSPSPETSPSATKVATSQSPIATRTNASSHDNEIRNLSASAPTCGEKVECNAVMHAERLAGAPLNSQSPNNPDGIADDDKASRRNSALGSEDVPLEGIGLYAPKRGRIAGFQAGRSFSLPPQLSLVTSAAPVRSRGGVADETIQETVTTDDSSRCGSPTASHESFHSFAPTGSPTPSHPPSPPPLSPSDPPEHVPCLLADSISDKSSDATILPVTPVNAWVDTPATAKFSPPPTQAFSTAIPSTPQHPRQRTTTTTSSSAIHAYSHRASLSVLPASELLTHHHPYLPTTKPLPPSSSSMTRHRPTNLPTLALVRQIPLAVMHKTCALLLTPPTYLIHLMLRVAARIAAGEWRGLVLGMDDEGARIPVHWDYSDVDDEGDMGGWEGDEDWTDAAMPVPVPVDSMAVCIAPWPVDPEYRRGGMMMGRTDVANQTTRSLRASAMTGSPSVITADGIVDNSATAAAVALGVD